MKLVMTLLVRDEEDILAANIECHLDQGVDLFIITDNRSVDGTRNIIERYVRRGVAVVLDERGDDYSQWRWVTRMARLAAVDYDADWVINSDADEFWLGSGAGGIKQELASIPPRAQCVVVQRSNFLPTEEGGGCFAEQMILRERESHNTLGDVLPPKVCHRGLADVVVDQGNHGVRRGGASLVGVPSDLRILHYPVRSYLQFENKIRNGGAAYDRNMELSPDVGRTWRQLYMLWQAGGLPAYYKEQVLSVQARDNGLLNGSLLRDETLFHILRQSHILRHREMFQDREANLARGARP